MKNTVCPLFAQPVVICGRRYGFSATEKQYIEGLEMAESQGNSMSVVDKVLESAELQGLKSFVDEQITAYKRELLRIPDDVEIYVTQSWVNRSDADQFHPKHKHPNSVISGVLFLDDNSDFELPAIRFHRSAELFPVDFSYSELNDFNASCREFDVEEGMLVLFPSTLEHDVDRNRSGRTRSSLSFNTYVRGTVGGKRQLTEVEIR